MRCLVIGTGNQAKNYLKVLKRKNFFISGICCTKRSVLEAIKLKKKYKIKKIFFSIKESLLDENYDVVFVFITWNKIEKYITEIIINSKKDIYIEKPIALSLGKLKKIIKLNSKYKKKIFILYNRRYLQTISYLKNTILKNKKFIFNINIPEHITRIEKKYGIKMKKKTKYFITSHWIDLLFFLLKKFKYKVANYNNMTSIFIKNNYCMGNVNINYNSIDQIDAKFFFSSKTIALFSLEKLFLYKKLVKSGVNYKMKTMKKIKETNEKFKPGLLRLMDSILNKKKKILPRLEDMLIMYKMLNKFKY
jgi:predicted dehydrogenase